LGIGPGDEVILPPYTFVATHNVVVLNYALPIFVDVDLDSFQMDPAKLERAITPNTKAIIPVHLGGNTADLDAVLAVAKKHNVPVIEDACQAHLSEWRGRMVGNWGLCGCFSFQASKNLNAGEGGAILTNDEEFAGRCELFHDQGRSRRSGRGGGDFTYAGNRGTNMRMTEWQGAMLLAQMTRLEAQSARRWENACFLNKALAGIPGISPARLYEGCTRSAYHLYMFRYNKDGFGGLEHGKFVQALNREGVPCSAGYSPLNADRYVTTLFNNNRHYQRLYSKDAQERWQAQCQCPVNEKLCSQAVWFTQNVLLGSRTDMEQIVEAVARIKAHAPAIAKA
jgi:dTDP-4-amino-4,6-dideoxygalactose transaminase